MNEPTKQTDIAMNPFDVADTLVRLSQLLREAGWDQKGGALLRDERDRVIGRVPWIARARWWHERPVAYNERECAAIVHKALRGERLGARQRAMLQFLYDLTPTLE